MKHDGKEELKCWLGSTWLPYVDRVPEMEKEAFLEELAGTYCRSQSYATDGEIYTKMVRLQVIANVSK